MVATLAVIESVIWLTRLSGTTRSPGRRPSNILYWTFSSMGSTGTRWQPSTCRWLKVARGLSKFQSKNSLLQIMMNCSKTSSWVSLWMAWCSQIPAEEKTGLRQATFSFILCRYRPYWTFCSSVLADLWSEPTPLAGMKELRWAEFFRPTSFMKGSRRSQYNEQ